MNSPAPRSKARQRRLLVRGLAVLVGLAPILLIEAGLRLAGIGDPARAADPLAGFAGSRPLFERVGEKFRTVRSRVPFFNPQEFSAQKPANGYRVFCFGGPTIYGHPYQSETAIPKWLELELAARNPGRRVEVVAERGVNPLLRDRILAGAVPH